MSPPPQPFGNKPHDPPTSRIPAPAIARSSPIQSSNNNTDDSPVTIKQNAVAPWKSDASGGPSHDDPSILKPCSGIPDRPFLRKQYHLRSPISHTAISDSGVNPTFFSLRGGGNSHVYCRHAHLEHHWEKCRCAPLRPRIRYGGRFWAIPAP